MNDAELNFSFDLANLDRQSLLDDAAQKIDERRAHLGEGDEVAETPEGALVRALADDVAQWAAFPDIYRITDKDFLAGGLQDVPVKFSQLSKSYRYYWLRLPIKLFPRRNWAFNRIEVFVEFNRDDAAAHNRPKAYQILPKREFQDLLAFSDHLEVRLNENFEFSAQTGEVAGQLAGAGGKLNAGVEAVADGGLGMVVGPFEYRLKKAKIQHTDTGAESVFWRVDGAEFFQENVPQFVVIVQVPKELENVNVHAELLAYRYFNFAEAGLQQAVSSLPKALRTFFEGGMPVGDKTAPPWDISPRL